MSEARWVGSVRRLGPPGRSRAGMAGRRLVLLAAAAAVCGAQPPPALPVAALRSRICANFFVPEPLPPPAAQTWRQFTPAPGVRAEALTYATEFGLRVPAILYLPDPLPAGGRIPGLVIVNGHGDDKYSWYSFYAGVLYARAGAAVLTYDQIGEGERNVGRKSGTRAHDRIQGDEGLARRLCGLMMTDAMEGVACLAARPEVDPSRLGVCGFSLGAFVGDLVGAVDARIRVCVLVGGGNLDGPNGYWETGSDKPMCTGLPYRSLRFLGDRPAVIYALHAARGPTLIWNGRDDTVVGMVKTPASFFDALRARVERLAGSPREVFDFGFTAGGSHRPYFVTRPVAMWLQRQLRFPHWTEGEIEAMPETHISVWARDHGVSIDHFYASERREGGTWALGNSVPGYQRDELSVFTPAQWADAKGRLILESWLAEARAAEAVGAR